MSSSSYVEIQNKMRALLTEHSFAHCLRTAETAAVLAEKHHEDVRAAKLAGLTHDVARDLSDEELLARARDLCLDILPAEADRPYLLHAKVGACMLSPAVGVEERPVAQAVECHTFGSPKMTNLDKIVYLADMIEPQRHFAGIEELRILAARDLHSAYVAGFKRQFIELIERNRVLHPNTLDAWNAITKEVSVDARE